MIVGAVVGIEAVCHVVDSDADIFYIIAGGIDHDGSGTVGDVEVDEKVVVLRCGVQIGTPGEDTGSVALHGFFPLGLEDGVVGVLHARRFHGRILSYIGKGEVPISFLFKINGVGGLTGVHLVGLLKHTVVLHAMIE